MIIEAGEAGNDVSLKNNLPDMDKLDKVEKVDKIEKI